jgi:hypothetical protein
MKWYYESDGGDFWTGSYWSRQPKVHYITNGIDDPIYCVSKKAAISLANSINAVNDYCKGFNLIKR